MNKLHLLIPSLFWLRKPRPEVHYDLSLPSLEKLLAKSTQSQQPTENIEAWLCNAFGVEKQQNWPIAPLMLQAEKISQISVGNDYWLRADPVHLRIEQNHILLADSQMFQISVKESKQLADIVNQHFAKEELVFIPISSDRWYLRLKYTPDLQLYSLNQIAGTNINNYLPSGSDKAYWHSKFNEIQMLLHDHPINQTRQNRGELTINSLWFWGGGKLPGSVFSSYSHIISNDKLTHALAIASNAQHASPPTNVEQWLQTINTSNPLVVLDTLWRKTQYNNGYAWREELKILEQKWFTPLLKALQKGWVTQLTITTIEDDNATNFMITRNSMRKFWRLRQTFASYVT